MLASRLQPWVEMCREIGGRIGIDPYLLLAVIDRESLGGEALTPKGPGGTGDGGNGLGLMQIDKRWHPEFCTLLEKDGNPSWQVPEKNITFGAQLLRNLIRLSGAEAVALCAYNAGMRRAQDAFNGCTSHDIERVVHALDQVTTGKDYVSDTLMRRAHIRQDLEHTHQEKAP